MPPADSVDSRGPIIESVARLLLLILLAVSGAACGLGAGDVTAALAPSSSASPTGGPSPSVGGPTGTAKAAIVVGTPQPGDEVVSPVTIAGTADVFEATVSIVILDASGQELAATFATATCGTGCRGRYSAEVSFFTETRQSGTIAVFESSAEDGSPRNLVTIPVLLVPGS